MKWLLVVILLSLSAIACIVPKEGMKIDRSVRFCPDVYYLKDGVVISGRNIIVDCSGTVFTSLKGGRGILVEFSSNVTVRGCRLVGYDAGFLVKNSTGVFLTDNHLVRTRVGTRFVGVSDSATLNHDVSLRTPFELVDSSRNALSLLNKPVRGSFCTKNFCGESKNGVSLFVQPRTDEVKMRSWLSDQVTGRGSLRKFRDWVFGGI